MPTFSVVVPVYNMQDHLQKCLDSLLNQTFTDFEILLVNDGSTDNSTNICNNYASKDNRIRLFHKENAGVSSARNLALDNVTGNYVTFVDADDYVSNDMLAKMAENIDDSTTVFSSPILPNGKNVGINFTQNNSYDILEYLKHYDIPDYLWGGGTLQTELKNFISDSQKN